LQRLPYIYVNRNLSRIEGSRDSSGGIAMTCEIDGWDSIPDKGKNMFYNDEIGS
jgi:hypothetical protein